MLIAIDGASKRNGKPDCRAAGSAVCPTVGKIFANSEMGSTNQRGELLGLICGLQMISRLHEAGQDDFIVVTDSEYIYNAMYSQWPQNWANKGWVTSKDEPVKNRDLWQKALQAYIEVQDVEITFAHIKGHLVSLGEVTGRTLLDLDPTGRKLIDAASEKYEVRKQSHAHLFEAAHELFKRNNGGMVDEVTFKKLVLANTLADYSATKYLAIQEAEADWEHPVDKEKRLAILDKLI